MSEMHHTLDALQRYAVTLNALERLKLPAGDCPPHVAVVPLSSVKRLINPPPPPAESEGGETD